MTQRNWFVTGASKGFGLSLTEQLLARGDTVFATLRNPQALEALAARYPDCLHIAKLDVTDTAEIRSVMAEAFKKLDRIDVIVSNAGYGLFGAAEEVTDAQIDQQIDTNIVGSVQLIRAALPHLRAQGGGRILQLSSEGGQIAYPNFSLYHLTKWAIEGFVESVAQEVAPFNIEFTLVEPGPTRTQFVESMISPAPMAEYEHTPAGEMRRHLAAGGFEVKGDAEKGVRAMIDSVSVNPAPKRLVLGSKAYVKLHAAWTSRLMALEAQKEVAYSVDTSM
jgi:NAD(P)-dependent dehydrogenase (short-subunit alcohol dehydrogenase family)